MIWTRNLCFAAALLGVVIANEDGNAGKARLIKRHSTTNSSTCPVSTATVTVTASASCFGDGGYGDGNHENGGYNQCHRYCEKTPHTTTTTVYPSPIV